jgi:hypothetical protein
MPAMLILDKALALDRIVAASQRIEVPEAFARRPFRIATFERIDMPIGAPALVLAAAEPVTAETREAVPAEPVPAVAPEASPARAFASHLPRALSWPAFSFSLSPQPEG